MVQRLSSIIKDGLFVPFCSAILVVRASFLRSVSSQSLIAVPDIWRLRAEKVKESVRSTRGQNPPQLYPANVVTSSNSVTQLPVGAK